MRKIIIIGGPTASYKSSVAFNLAQNLDGVIINADSIQVYQEIPILSSQPSSEERNTVNHKLYGYIPGNNVYSVGKWLNQAVREIEFAHISELVPIIVGGTGMYINSLVNGLSKIPDIDSDLRHNIRELYDRIGKKEFYQLLQNRDPDVASTLKEGDKQRVIRAYEVIEQTGKSITYWQMSRHSSFSKDSFIYIVANPPRENLYQRCDNRFLTMIEEGALDEVEYLSKTFELHDMPISKALGIKELQEYLKGKINFATAVIRAQTATRQFAKRQVTWFKNQLPNLDRISYSTPDDFDQVNKHVATALDNF